VAALTGDIKVFIVERLACFDSPTDIQKQLKQDFRVDVSLQQLTAYNPKTQAGARLSKTLREVFEATRKKYLEDTSDVAIAHKAHRLRVLDRLLTRLERSGNALLAAQMLEQAAKEEGGAFTNRRELHGPGGGPMVVTIKDLTGRKPA
jgi:hypothetical protein